MTEDISPRSEVKRQSPSREAEEYLAFQGIPKWGGGVTADFLNAAVALTFECRREQSWSKIKPVQTIQEYVRGHAYSRFPSVDASEVADAIIERINPEFLKKANEIISEMNTIIGAVVTKQTQADVLLELYRSFENLVERQS